MKLSYVFKYSIYHIFNHKKKFWLSVLLLCLSALQIFIGGASLREFFLLRLEFKKIADKPLGDIYHVVLDTYSMSAMGEHQKRELDFHNKIMEMEEIKYIGGIDKWSDGAIIDEDILKMFKVYDSDGNRITSIEDFVDPKIKKTGYLYYFNCSQPNKLYPGTGENNDVISIEKNEGIKNALDYRMRCLFIVFKDGMAEQGIEKIKEYASETGIILDGVNPLDEKIIKIINHKIKDNIEDWLLFLVLFIVSIMAISAVNYLEIKSNAKLFKIMSINGLTIVDISKIVLVAMMIKYLVACGISSLILLKALSSIKQLYLFKEFEMSLIYIFIVMIVFLIIVTFIMLKRSYDSMDHGGDL